MNLTRTFFTALAVALVLLAAGCGFLKNEEGTSHVILKKGWQCASEQHGWVAVPKTEPARVENKEKGLTYHVLATHNVVPAHLGGFYAMHPDLFKKQTGIEVGAKSTPKSELWEMRDGRRVPEEKDGWIGVALRYPEVEGGQLAIVRADQLIPQEMDGWAVIDVETFAKIRQQKILEGATIEKKQRPKEE